MRLLMALFAGSLLLLASGTALAEDSDHPRRDRMLERFDTDGDGTLNDDERSAAREVWREHKSDRREHRADRREHRADRRERMLERFDSDGDGSLNDDERGAAREARHARRAERREHGRSDPRRGHRGRHPQDD